MYGSERFTLPLPRPFPVYIPRPATAANKPVPSKSDLDDFAYRPELPQSPSTENSGENRTELLASSEMRDFSSCFTSYAPPLATISSSLPSASFMGPAMPMKETMGASESRLYINTENLMDCEGTSREDDRKCEREHRKRSKNWTRPETLRLIRVRSAIDGKFGRMGKKSELWDQIADALQGDGFSRDVQQCKDKWEKLCASYKDVRDGIREKEDFPYYDELHLLLSGRSKKREREGEHTMGLIKERHETGQIEELELDLSGEIGLTEGDSPQFYAATGEPFADMHPEHAMDYLTQVKKREKIVKYMPITDLPAVQELMDSLLAKQQKFFTDLLDAVEKREQLKEKVRQEREDRWRAEEREQKRAFNNAMIILTKRLLGETSSAGFAPMVNSGENLLDEQGGPKKRSKNWKRSEVLQLIKLRIEMDSKFTTPTRRAALWEELAEALGAQGIHRDGKQCREKWDKLMAEFKDVMDGKRDQSESPFFTELKTFMAEGHCNP